MPVLSWLFVAGRSRYPEWTTTQLSPSTGQSRRWSELGGAAPSPCQYQPSFLWQPVRPSPQSQSFSRSYGSNLPTSLTYIVLGLEAVHLGDLLRIWVRPVVKFTLTPSDFQGPTGVHRTAQDPRCFTEANVPISEQVNSRDYAPYKEKRTLPGTPADVSEFVCVTALDAETPISTKQGREC